MSPADTNSQNIADNLSIKIPLQWIGNTGIIGHIRLPKINGGLNLIFLDLFYPGFLQTFAPLLCLI
jgi:hypothetical protein